MSTEVKPLPGMVIIANDNIDMAFVYEGNGLKEGINYREATKEEAEEFFRLNPSMKEKSIELAEKGWETNSIEKEPTLTFGQKAVGITFNPGGNPQVDRVKQHYANIIDGLEELRKESTSDIQKEFIKQAYDAAIVGQMLAVKAITWKD